MTWVTLALHTLWILPLLTAALLKFGFRGATQHRIVSLAAAWPVFFLALALFIHESVGREYTTDHSEFSLGWFHAHFAVDGLNAVLLPLTIPGTVLRRRGFR